MYAAIHSNIRIEHLTVMALNARSFARAMTVLFEMNLNAFVSLVTQRNESPLAVILLSPVVVLAAVATISAQARGIKAGGTTFAFLGTTGTGIPPSAWPLPTLGTGIVDPKASRRGISIGPSGTNG